MLQPIGSLDALGLRSHQMWPAQST